MSYSTSFSHEPHIWYDHEGHNSTDLFNNLTTESVQQKHQLNRRAMMPSGWHGTQPSPKTTFGKHDDWNRFTVSEAAANRYISSVGSARVQHIDRSSAGRKYGTINLLRSLPPVAMTNNHEGPWFNDSSDRMSIVHPHY